MSKTAMRWDRERLRGRPTEPVAGGPVPRDRYSARPMRTPVPIPGDDARAQFLIAQATMPPELADAICVAGYHPFVRSCRAQWTRKQSLTERQIAALKRFG